MPIVPVRRSELEGALARASAAERRWVGVLGFEARPGAIALLPTVEGALGRVLLGVDEGADPWSWAAAHATLPAGVYVAEVPAGTAEAEAAAFGWGLASYRFDRYKAGDTKRPRRKLVWPERVEVETITALVEATFLGRDLINTPAEDLGPDALCTAGAQLAERHGGKAVILRGKELLRAGYPAIHAVGRAANKPPCLLDFTWGDENAPKLTLVGKGVTFDSGGLDIKPASAMRLMKKDMGGAATVLALAHVLMSRKLPVRLRVLVPAVENAISGDAYRPGDVVKTRSGLSVEIGNTDAEGRVILADALFEAASEAPALLLDFATLTGAARVALGVGLPALFTNDDSFAALIDEVGRPTRDPLWRLPLHAAYRRQIDSPIADLQNVGGEYAGAITAALFLQEFVKPGVRWAHIDTMAYNVDSQPGRPLGGEPLGLRAFSAALTRRFGATTSAPVKRAKRR